MLHFYLGAQLNKVLVQYFSLAYCVLDRSLICRTVAYILTNHLAPSLAVNTPRMSP